MPDVPPELVERAIAIIGADGISEDDIEARVLPLADNAMLARRLIDWPPEAFGLVLIPHMAEVTLPTRFSARSARGEWLEFDFSAEPVFVHAVSIAMRMYHEGPRATFRNVASRSSTMDAVNRALNAGETIDGATLSGPALNAIPAEVYSPRGARL